jgi:hypothetical protein
VAAIYSVDGFDLYQFTRVNPGEGLDPADPEILQAEFGQAGGLEGDPLISLAAENREFVLPVLLDPRKNMLTEGGFETDLAATAWSLGFGAAFERSSAWAYDGLWSARCTTTAMGVSGQQSVQSIGPLANGYYPAVAGRRYRLAGVINLLSRTGNGAVYLQVNWYDSAGVYISSGTTNQVTALGVTKCAADLTAPANAVAVSVLIVANEGAPNPPTSTLDFYADAISFSDIDATQADLHRLVANVNRRLRNAKTLAWREDGATDSSYLNVLFARFEPEYDFRRAGTIRLAGTVRLTCRPYGHTGTSRIVGTAAGSGVSCEVSLPTIVGDVGGLTEGLVQVGSAAVRGRITAFAMLPASYVADWAAASISLETGAGVLVGASGAAGSQAVQATGLSGRGQIGRALFAPATVYQGRNRVLAVARCASLWVQPPPAIRAYDDDGLPLAPADGVPSVAARAGWGTVDLGVLSVPTHGRATVAVRLHADPGIEINRLVVLPEDELALTVDTGRRAAGLDTYPAHPSTAGILGLDDVGNSWERPSSALASNLVRRGAPAFANNPPDGELYAEPTYAFVPHAAVLAHPTLVDLTVEAYANSGAVAWPSHAYAVGKITAPGHIWARAQGVGTGGLFGLASRYVLNLLTNDSTSGLTTPSVLASMSVPMVPARFQLTFRQTGPRVSAEMRDGRGDLVASVGASIAIAGLGGRAGLYMVPHVSSPTAVMQWYVTSVERFEVRSEPSRPVAARDMVRYAGQLDGAVERRTSASAVTGRLDAQTQGKISQAVPAASLTRRAAAFALPLDGGPTSDLIAAEVRATERFLYHRT